jgi:hypothetical protein
VTVDAADGFGFFVLHRLALGVEPIDAVTGDPVGRAVRVEREVPELPGRRPRRGAARSGALDPLGRPAGAALETNGTARFKLRFTLPHGRRAGTIRPTVPPGRPPGTPPSLVVRVEDPRRRHVPRRFEVQLWTLAEVEAADRLPPAAPGPYVPVGSRLLRPWLLPGAAYPMTRTATGLRGRVVDAAGARVPWPRVEARGPGDLVVGRAHGDERGEFLLLVTGTGILPPPPPSTLDVQLVLRGPDPAAGAGDPASPPLEPVTRSSVPPAPGDLDSPLLRGETPPAGYVAAARLALTIPVGRVLAQAAPFPFTP